MRTSSCSDLNAHYRAKQPVLIDFFAKEAAEQQEGSTFICQQGPFAELTHNRATPSLSLNSIAETSASADSEVNVISLRNFLHSKAYPTGQHMYDSTIQSRLDIANLSAKTLLTALEIIDNPNHPLLETIRLKETERYSIFNKLCGIVNQSGGFTKSLRIAALRANNNPDQLIINFQELV